MNRFIIVDGLPYLYAKGKAYAVRWDEAGFTVGAEVELKSAPAAIYNERSIKAKCAACLDSIGADQEEPKQDENPEQEENPEQVEQPEQEEPKQDENPEQEENPEQVEQPEQEEPKQEEKPKKTSRKKKSTDGGES